jgi:hypothetical protein
MTTRHESHPTAALWGLIVFSVACLAVVRWKFLHASRAVAGPDAALAPRRLAAREWVTGQK